MKFPVVDTSCRGRPASAKFFPYLEFGHNDVQKCTLHFHTSNLGLFFLTRRFQNMKKGPQAWGAMFWKHVEKLVTGGLLLEIVELLIAENEFAFGLSHMMYIRQAVYR